MDIQRFISGPPPTYPRFIDKALEAWARAHPKVRLLATIMAIIAIVTSLLANSGKVDPEPTQKVWVAASTISPITKDTGEYEQVAMPVSVVPKTAVTERPVHPPLFPIVSGTVVTQEHFEVNELAKTLPEGNTLIALPAQDASVFVVGMAADIWNISSEKPTLLLKNQPVVGIRKDAILLSVPSDQAGELSALLLSGTITTTAALGS